MKRTVALATAVAVFAASIYLGSQSFAQVPGAGAPGAGAPAGVEPHTRVALINLAFVVKNYKKWESFQSEVKSSLTGFETQMKKLTQMIDERKTAIQNPATQAADKERYQAEIVRCQRDLEDLNASAKKFLGQKSDQQMVIIYRDIQDMATRYAISHNFDLVLHYVDSTQESEIAAPGNIARKMQAGACVPLYIAPGMDISQQVVSTLNAAYQPQQTAPAPAPSR